MQPSQPSTPSSSPGLLRLEAFEFARLQAIVRLERRAWFLRLLYPLTRRGWLALPALYVTLFSLLVLGVPLDPDAALFLLQVCAAAAFALVLAEEWTFNQRLRVRTQTEVLRKAHAKLVSGPEVR